MVLSIVVCPPLLRLPEQTARGCANPTVTVLRASCSLMFSIYSAPYACSPQIPSAACCAMQTRLDADIEHKQQLKQRVEQQLQQDMQRFKDMEREAAALISKARHANSKLMVGFYWC